MPYQKKKKKYSNTYYAQWLRKKRMKMVNKNPLALRKCVWVIEGLDNKQYAFVNRNDIKIKRINKQELRDDCIKTF